MTGAVFPHSDAIFYGAGRMRILPGSAVTIAPRASSAPCCSSARTQTAACFDIGIHDPDDVGVQAAKGNREFAEILVEGHDDPALARSQRQDFVVRRIIREVMDPEDVMTVFSKFEGRARPDAGVKQKLHAASMKGSTRSRPTSRCAKARQARISSASSQG